jgi:hypothetical protein
MTERRGGAAIGDSFRGALTPGRPRATVGRAGGLDFGHVGAIPDARSSGLDESLLTHFI